MEGVHRMGIRASTGGTGAAWQGGKEACVAEGIHNGAAFATAGHHGRHPMHPMPRVASPQTRGAV